VSDDSPLDFDEQLENEPVQPTELLNQKRVRINISVKPSVYTELMQIAQAEDMTLRALARIALQQWIKNYKINGL
jgi:predicted DNA-binding protein (UPF0278 family)